MDQKKVGEFIAACRKEQGLTQAQIAEKMGVSNRAVSKWETGQSCPDAAKMIELCELLGITVNELLSGEREEKNESISDAKSEAEPEDKVKEHLPIIATIVLLLYVVFKPDLFRTWRTLQIISLILTGIGIYSRKQKLAAISSMVCAALVVGSSIDGMSFWVQMGQFWRLPAMLPEMVFFLLWSITLFGKGNPSKLAAAMIVLSLLSVLTLIMEYPYGFGYWTIGFHVIGAKILMITAAVLWKSRQYPQTGSLADLSE